MRARRLLFLFVLMLQPACEPAGRLLFASPQVDPLALSLDGSLLYVANTTSNTVSVVDTASQSELLQIPVGIEPVSVAVRPDGLEVWVANHVSDSVSVIDANPASPTFHHVIETVQDLDPVANGGATWFDEPVGIAFASNQKAYVALSSRNEVAIVDVATYSVSGSLTITAQDPRAIRVRNGRLYVLAFESSNQSELSACGAGNGTSQCTFGFQTLLQVATDPNLPGVPKNVVVDPDVPDRDLFVFDTSTDALVGSPVTAVGTLLYGMAVDSQGVVYVTNTDARNHDQDGNGLAAPVSSGVGLGETLVDLDNRAFHNQISRVDCSGGGGCGAALKVPLEPAPPQQPAAGTQLATPYGIQVTADDQRVVFTAAGSDRVASANVASGTIVSRVDVGANPRGLALRDNGDGTHTAYVLETLDNTVRILNVAVNGALAVVGSVAVGSDPTPEEIRLGRIAFNSAAASSTGTFSCASCHPDAHTDQLLWVIGATCDECDQEEPRSTMPIRGLRETLPLHWDGTLGDPFGGPNGETGPGGSVAANCSANDPEGCFRHLVNASLSGVMCSQPVCPTGPSGMPGPLSDSERQNMARFLGSVSYPPARSRRIDDTVTAAASQGFADFFMDQGGNGGGVAQTCADTTGGCHALPLGVSSNSPVVGAFDAPTMRGMTDRFLQFSGGFTSPEEVMDLAAFAQGQGVIPWNPAVGLDELTVFSVAFTAFNPVYNVFPDDMFQMFEEASTGFSGAFARQVSLNSRTASGALRAGTEALLAALEERDEDQAVNLHGAGVRNGSPIQLWYLESSQEYIDQSNPPQFQLTRTQILDEAEAGTLVMTFTADLRLNTGSKPMPLISVDHSGSGPTGDPDLPVLPGDNPIGLTAVTVVAGAGVRVDGQLVEATLSCVGGTFDPFCTSNTIEVELLDPPTDPGLHLLQLENKFNQPSNELPFCVGSVNGCR